MNRTPIVAVAVLNILAYLLVLLAMALPNAPVGYVVPLRTASVLFGVLFGTEVLQEGRRWVKLIASALMMAGMGLIAVLG